MKQFFCTMRGRHGERDCREYTPHVMAIKRRARARVVLAVSNTRATVLAFAVLQRKPFGLAFLLVSGTAQLSVLVCACACACACACSPHRPIKQVPCQCRDAPSASRMPRHARLRRPARCSLSFSCTECLPRAAPRAPAQSCPLFFVFLLVWLRSMDIWTSDIGEKTFCTVPISAVDATASAEQSQPPCRVSSGR